MCIFIECFTGLKRNALKQIIKKHKKYTDTGVKKMDNTFGTIVSYRPDIKVVDATLRDGGLVNNFGFTTEFVKDLYNLSYVIST